MSTLPLRSALVCTIAAALFLLAGCGGHATAPVSGTITIDNQPLAEARVSFIPISTPGEARVPSEAVTDSQGKYSLTMVDGRPGAVVGEHEVQIRTDVTEVTATGDVRVVKPERLPARFHAQTELRHTVPPGGDEQANFNLPAR